MNISCKFTHVNIFLSLFSLVHLNFDQINRAYLFEHIFYSRKIKTKKRTHNTLDVKCSTVPTVRSAQKLIKIGKDYLFRISCSINCSLYPINRTSSIMINGRLRSFVYCVHKEISCFFTYRGKVYRNVMESLRPSRK